MNDRDLDNAIASNTACGELGVQHAVFMRLRNENPVHWTEPDGISSARRRKIMCFEAGRSRPATT